MFTAKKKDGEGSQTAHKDHKDNPLHSTEIVEYLMGLGLEADSDNWMKEQNPSEISQALFFIAITHCQLF